MKLPIPIPIPVPARKHKIAGALLVAAALLAPAASDFAAAAEAAKPPPKPAWMTPQWAAEKAKLIEQGKQYRSAWAFYQDLKKKAGGGQRLSWDKLPDWSGVYSRPMAAYYGLSFDLDQ